MTGEEELPEGWEWATLGGGLASDIQPGFACGVKLTRSFGLGKHIVRVKARNSAGLTDASAAVFGFRVRRVG